MNFTKFYNKEGDSILLRFREFQPKDAEAIVDLIRDEYGENYNTPEFYDKDKIIQRYNEGKVIFQVAELDSGKIVACLNIKRNFPRENYCGMGTGIVLKAYRKYRIFEPLAKYVMEKIHKLPNVSAIYVVLVMYQEITQHLFDRLGLTACGITPSMVLADTFIHSYSKDDNQKLTFLFSVTNIAKFNVGKIYIPAEHKEIVQDIYDSLKTQCEIETKAVELSSKSVILVEDDQVQQVCSISIDEVGADLRDRIIEIESQRKQSLQTFNVFLNIKDEKAVAAYDTLKDMGYFFCGLKPLISNDREVMIMHNPKKVPIHFDTLLAIENYAPLRDYVKNCYESRCKS